MKPILGIDITFDKKSDTITGEEFITKTVSKQKAGNLSESAEELDSVISEAKLPTWLSILKALCGIYAAIVLVGILRNVFEISFAQMLENAAWLIYSGAASGIIWISLVLYERNKAERVMTDRGAERLVEELEADVLAAYEELGVPEDAPDVDILCFKYKMVNGSAVPKTPFPQTTCYVNVELKLFATEEGIHLADPQSVYTFNPSEITAIRKFTKRISIPTWNKDVSPTKGEYEQYKMSVNNYGNVFIKPFYALEINRNGERFGIYFPCYELPAFERVTGLRAEL